MTLQHLFVTRQRFPRQAVRLQQQRWFPKHERMRKRHVRRFNDHTPSRPASSKIGSIGVACGAPL